MCELFFVCFYFCLFVLFCLHFFLFSVKSIFFFFFNFLKIQLKSVGKLPSKMSMNPYLIIMIIRQFNKSVGG